MRRDLILGVNAYSNNAGIALYDGRLHVCVEEERFNREKKSSKFPHCALDAMYPDGLAAGDLEAIAFPWSPRPFVANYLKILGAEFPRSLQLLSPASSRESNSILPLRALTSLRRDVGRHTRGRPPRVQFVEHHHAHAAAAFFSSPFDDAAVLVADAFGDTCSISAYVADGTAIREVQRNYVMNSLGVLYSCVTLYLGYKTVLDEGKIMALASYGTDEFVADFGKIIKPLPGGEVEFDFSYLNFQRAGEIRPFTKKFEQLFGPPRRPGEPLEQRHKDLAAALQRATEAALLHITTALRESSGKRNLVYAGGVAMNCVAAGRIAREAGFEEMFIPASPDDGGESMGAAMYVHHCLNGKPREDRLDHPYHGPEFSDSEIDRALARREHSVVKDPAVASAELIDQGAVVGWFQGRMEMGPRALGNRSILADPRSRKMRDHLNRDVKHREEYRPYAPSVLDKRVREYYPGSPYSPFMSFTSTVAGKHADEVPAVTHVDGTARVQSVRQDVAPLYHRLISEFERRSGVPMVLNTSLNDREPICCTPDDALRCFDGTEIDALFLGDRLVTKDGFGEERSLGRAE